jgi:hypothetical protein
VAETFGPGQSADALVAAPPSTTDAKLMVYDNSAQLHNSNTGGIGGMLTTINATGAGGGSDTSGPATRNVAYNDTTDALTATVDDSATGGTNVAAAEYFLDTVGAPGSGAPLSGTFTSPSVNVSDTVTVGTN